MRLSLSIFSFVGLSALVAHTGCLFEDRSCSLVGCLDQVDLTLRPEDPGFQQGVYEISLGANLGDPVQCSFTVGDEGVGANDCGEIQPDGSLAIIFRLGPEQLDLDVARDGQVVVDETLTPTYEEPPRSGEDCEMHCRQGEAEAAVP